MLQCYNYVGYKIIYCIDRLNSVYCSIYTFSLLYEFKMIITASKSFLIRHTYDYAY